MIRISALFLPCQAVGFIGLSGASLSLTTVAFAAGQRSGRPATRAGLILALMAIFAVLAAPYGPKVVRALSHQRAYAGICGGYAVVYICGRLLMVALGPRGPIAYCVAPLAGIATGWFGPASQQALVAYSQPTHRAKLMTKMAMSLGGALTQSWSKPLVTPTQHAARKWCDMCDRWGILVIGGVMAWGLCWITSERPPACSSPGAVDFWRQLIWLGLPATAPRMPNYRMPNYPQADRSTVNTLISLGISPTGTRSQRRGCPIPVR